MFNIEESLSEQILSFGGSRPTVIFTEAKDPRLLEAVCYLTRFLRPVLLAAEDAVRDVFDSDLKHLESSRIEYTISETSFITISEKTELVSEFAIEYKKTIEAEGGSISLKEAHAKMLDPCMFGIFAVRLGHADMVVGGSTHEPVTYFRPMLKYLKKKPVQSETGVFVLPDEHPENIYSNNIIVFGDVGVNATMTPENLAMIAVDTCTIARNLFPDSVLPNVHGVIVSYSNHGSDEGPSPELVKNATKLVPALLKDSAKADERYSTISIEGEIKANVAFSERSAMYYNKENQEGWTGPTNVIICPNLDMGNLLYHLYATRFPEAKKFTIISGVGFSAVDLAKDCSSEDIRLGVKAPILNLLQKEGWQKTRRDTFFRRYKVLAINPGSTSTKVSVYEGDYELCTEELQHSAKELAPYEGKPVTDQFQYRKEMIMSFLADNGLSIEDLDAVAGRGGLVRPIKHGTYRVNKKMLDDLKAGIGGEHASNLGALIANEIVSGTELPAFIIDPIVVDEVDEKVKITGLSEIRRYIISHALNQIASAKRYAEEHETFYENLNIIVAHMGGGISVGAHYHGRYIDVNNALNGEGPFSPQRSGTLPIGPLIDLCYSGKYTKDEMKKLNKGRGGLINLLGTNDLRDVEKMIEDGDDFASLVFDALVYQMSKEITSLVPAFKGEAVDQVILTGGMARSEKLAQGISDSVKLLGCGVTIYPGENEMYALAKGTVRVLQGKESAREYHP
jgi:butyrate kinase